MKHWVLAVAAMSFSLMSFSRGAPAGVQVEGSWARATFQEASNGAAFVTLTDTSGHGDILVAASSPIASLTELHVHKTVSGITQMRPVSVLPIPAGGSITLQPGAEHVMLIGLRQPLREGVVIPLHLVFATSNVVETTVPVRDVGATGPPDHHTGHDEPTRANH
ncbi:Copper metallochaperone, bacterial analog of Cox17 protein [invertebrate metagenome]|uniref:Copper metallochaperone, bacterial analog of Cox17 protein n=1 Tax=invertebrate metagenome TaxID=1711999 RepID=A0A484H597_9ZZZZ